MKINVSEFLLIRISVMRLDPESLRFAGWCEAHPKNSTIITAKEMLCLFFFIEFSGIYAWLFFTGLPEKNALNIDLMNLSI